MTKEEIKTYTKLLKKEENWGHNFNSEDEISVMAQLYINSEPLKYSKDNPLIKSPEWNIAANAELINRRYRTDQPKEYDEIDIEEMFKSYTTSTNLIVYRGIEKSIYTMMKANAKKLHERNVDLYEKGFMSTSLIKDNPYSNRQYQLRIFVPTGTHAFYCGNINNEIQNLEVIINHGSKLKIISKRKNFINCLLLEEHLST